MSSAASTRWVAFLCVAACAAGAARAQSPPPGLTHAVLIDGGGRPATNYLSHLHHLQEMVTLLEARGVLRERIAVFSSDGEDSGADLAVRETPPAGFWLIEGLPAGDRLAPRTELTDTRWPGVTLRPASKAALLDWFTSSRKRLRPNDWLLLFVTDHGTGGAPGGDDAAISLWNEKLTVRELRGMIRLLPPGVRTVMLMSQCYSGSFAEAIHDGDEPSGRVCGFFSTEQDQKAYGCYPEGRDRDRMGYAFQVIEALQRRAGLDAAHREAVITDDTPDVPLSTTDLYLREVVDREARSGGVAVEALADRLLAEAWKDRGRWRRELGLLDQLAEAYGLFSPRSLAELADYGAAIPGFEDRLDKQRREWAETLADLRSRTLQAFLAQDEDLRGRVGSHADLDAAGRSALLGDLLPPLEEFARASGDRWTQIDDLRGRVDQVSQTLWRLKVRAAAMQRMRAVLIGVAGRSLLARGPASARRVALDRLESCEALEPGGVPPPGPDAGTLVFKRLPPMEEDARSIGQLLPSWLGISYGAVPTSIRSLRALPAGASRVIEVWADSPAMEAGLQPGDILIGPPDRPFETTRQAREWVTASPGGVPVKLAVLRPGAVLEDDVNLDLSVVFRPWPLRIGGMPAPPRLGAPAPPLPVDLEPIGAASLPDLSRRAHLLFFWATGCQACGTAVPEVRAFAQAKGLPVLAITGEDPALVSGFLKKRAGPFFDLVAADPRHRSVAAYGVQSTPTVVLVDADGAVAWRQVGYVPHDGLKAEGWIWPLRPAEPGAGGGS